MLQHPSRPAVLVYVPPGLQSPQPSVSSNVSSPLRQINGSVTTYVPSPPPMPTLDRYAKSFVPQWLQQIVIASDRVPLVGVHQPLETADKLPDEAVPKALLDRWRREDEAAHAHVQERIGTGKLRHGEQPSNLVRPSLPLSLTHAGSAELRPPFHRRAQS